MNDSDAKCLATAADAKVGAGRRGAVAVIIEHGRFLVIRRAEGIAAPGKICFPGGGIEADETEEAALRRELREELDVAVQPIRRLWEGTTPWGVHLAWWSAARDAAAPLRPNPAEVAEVFWLTPEELAAHADLLPSNRDFLVALAEGEFTLGADLSESTQERRHRLG